MFEDQLREVIDSINNKRKAPVTLEEGSDVLDICLAAKQSLAQGEVKQI